MRSCEWVLDTWLLEIAQDPQDPRALDALALLQEIKSNHKITVDHEHRILGEYYAHAPPNSHAGQWIRVTINKANKVFWRNGTVPARNERELLDNLSFDRADLPFVGVAASGPDKIIVSEDSDYSDLVTAYLSDEMGITVFSVGEALKKARDP